LAEKKVYDFKVETVKNKIVGALKKRQFESTVTDLVAATGLPTLQVQETIKAVADEYSGHMKVTDSGEILYYFPAGLHSRLHGFRPTMKRFLRRLGSTTAKVLSLLFKIWIMVMLIGYFVLFVALLVVAVLASIATSVAGGSSDNRRSRSDGLGGFMGFYFTTRVIQLFIELWLYSSLTRGDGPRRQRRPLHRSVFSYVFGEGDPNRDWEDTEKKAVIRYLQGNKGAITLEEFMTLTGLPPDDAQHRINRYLLEFGGEPSVTQEGTLYYRFVDLLKTRDLPSEPAIRSAPKRRLFAFSGNKPGTNRWITFFNSFNLLFGGYFLYYSLAVPVIQKGDGFAYLYLVAATLCSRFLGLNPHAVLPIALGVIPVAFSLLFFLIPLLRRGREKAHNEAIKKGNFLRRLYDRVLQNPLLVDPSKIEPGADDEAPTGWEGFRERSVKDFAAFKGADVDKAESGGYVYRFGELDREQRDLSRLRNSIDLSSFNLGKTIYDSGE